MANGAARFQKLQFHTLFLLWSVLVVNGLEILIYLFRKYVLRMYGGCWVQFGVLFYLVWSICAMVASGVGVYGIMKRIPDLLTYTDLYFLCSASFKAFYAVLLLFIFPAGGPGLGVSITYASTGPFLLILMNRFFIEFQSLPIVLAHIITIGFLLYMAFLIKRYRNVMLRGNINLVADQHNFDGIPL